MNHTKYDRQAQQDEIMFHEWDDNQEDHVAEQFGEIWDGALKIFVSIISCIGLFAVLCAIAVDVLNNL